MPIIRCLIPVLLLLLATPVYSQQPKTGLKGRQLIYCPCSPSKRGYRVDASEAVQEHIEEVHQVLVEGTAERAPREEIVEEMAMKSQELWANCVADYSMEECVNADTSLRSDPKCEPNCASFCEYDPGSWRNNANGEYGPACDTVAKFRSTAREMNSNSSQIDPTDIVPKTPTNPNPGVEKPLEGAVITRPQQSGGRPPAGISSIPKGDGEAPAEKVPVTESVPSTSSDGGSTATDTPTTTTPINTTTATIPESVQGNDTGPGDLEGVPLETLIPTTNEDTDPVVTNLNEGCVAVEHLKGYTLQHERHLKRGVLCAKGFCATPNHALIVDGKWTSMRILCKTWECVNSVKHVNNLKLAVNRRANYVPDADTKIIITPYDMRFPRWCIWVVQTAEDVLHLVAAACILALVTALLVLIGCAVKEL